MQRLRNVLAACIAISMILLLWGGAIRYPDAPIHPCPTGYCGKHGQHHTEADYRLFRIWDTALWIYWPIAMCALFILNRKELLKKMGRNI
jgi:hypothetical protein